MSLIIKIIPDLPSQTPSSNRAMQGRSGSFFQVVFSPALRPQAYRFNGLNKADVTFTASILKSDGNDLHLSPIDRDIYPKGKSMDTPNGWGYLVIGS